MSSLLLFFTLIYLFFVGNKTALAGNENKMPVVTKCYKNDVLHYGAECAFDGLGCVPNDPCKEQE